MALNTIACQSIAIISFGTSLIASVIEVEVAEIAALTIRSSAVLARLAPAITFLAFPSGRFFVETYRAGV